MKSGSIRIYLVLVLLIANAAQSQESLSYSSRWQLKPSFGYYVSATKLLKGDVTDYLIEHDDRLFYWQVLSVSHFFHKHWGLEFNFQGVSSAGIAKRADRFIQSIHAEYENEHFVSPSTSASHDNFSPLSGHMERGFLGLIYRLETNRFFFYPKFSVGVTSFYTDWGKAYLKERNSNNFVEVSYETAERVRDYFTIATTAAFGYKLTKRIFLNVDLLSSSYRTNITYHKTVTNLNTGLKSIDEKEYKKNIVNLSIGTGMIIVIK